MGKTYVDKNIRDEEYEEIKRRRNNIKRRINMEDDDSEVRHRKGKFTQRQSKWDDESWDRD